MALPWGSHCCKELDGHTHRSEVAVFSVGGATRYVGGMGEAGNREKGRGYFARRIWHGPDETCWHVWLEAPVTHQFRKSRGATVTFVQLHGTGTQQIVRIIPEVDDQYMTDRALLTLYLFPKPEQMLGSYNAL